MLLAALLLLLVATPALAQTPKRERAFVYGVNAALARMDALERVGQPGGYRRELIEVQAMDPAAPDPLSAYVYLQSPAMLDLAGDHLGPLALYTLEHARSLRW